MMKKITFLLLLVGLMSSAFGAKKVLYVTHEPGRWHRYTPQLAAFKDIAKEAKWELTVSTGSYNEQVKKMASSDFAKGFDAVIYNFCLAACNDMKCCSNIIRQTEELGVPCLLVHCSMHSFWSTFKAKKNSVPVEGSHPKAKADPKVLAKWKKENPGKKFPVWGDFTGVASTGHGPKKPVTCEKLKADHPALKNLPDNYVTANTELYNNYYTTKDVIPLIKGKQGKGSATIMWEAPRGKSVVMGLTLGHAEVEWKEKNFRQLMIDTVNYLADK